MRKMSIVLIGAATLGGCGSWLRTPRADGASRLAAAEAFVDAFYSFDAQRLTEALSTAPESVPRISYYQGWAEGGNYTILHRMPCRAESAEWVSCSITVKDDLSQALGLAIPATDTLSPGLFGREDRQRESQLQRSAGIRSCAGVGLQ